MRELELQNTNVRFAQGKNRAEITLSRVAGHNTQTKNSSVSLEARLVVGPYRAEQATRFTGGHDFSCFPL